MIELTDTHCHIQSIGTLGGERTTSELWSKKESLTIDSVIKDAKNSGVNRLLAVGCDYPDSMLAADLASKHSNVWASTGIHPHEAKLYSSRAIKLKEFAALAGRDKVVAIGECGLDYYYNHSPKEDQIKLLKFQIELALKLNLPLIFHVREAFNDFWSIFDNYSGIRGVLHSFTDSQENMQRAIDNNLYIGVNGIATFTKNEKQLAVYKSIPLTRLLLETDSPFLTPVPYRGKINEPKRLLSVAEFLADLQKQSLEELAKSTTKNATELFGLQG